MYQLFIHIYLLGVAIASLFSKKVGLMWRGEREAVEQLRKNVDPQAQYVWVHAASLGEFEQGRPIIERIRRERKDLKILLTFFSPSGYEVRKNYEGADIVCYLPIDTPRNARRFLDAIHPVAAFFIKYEFWYNYINLLNKRGVPLYSVSSIFRESQLFFKWYNCGYRRVLGLFTKFFVQNEESKSLLHGIGIDSVEVTGDTRFDRVIDIRNAAKQLPYVEKFKNSQPCFVAGSSWQPDEDIFIPFFNELKNWKVVIAPHVIGEDHLKQIEAQLVGRKVVRYTKITADTDLANAEVMIIDCFGLLSSIYNYADVTYVGGGFGVGIHNLLEAAVWSKPVFFGPNNARFQEAQDLKACGGGIEIASAADFNTKMQSLIEDKSLLQTTSLAAGEYVSSRAGVVEKVMQNIEL